MKTWSEFFIAVKDMREKQTAYDECSNDLIAEKFALLRSARDAENLIDEAITDHDRRTAAGKER
jgi:hypothetical protein